MNNLELIRENLVSRAKKILSERKEYSIFNSINVYIKDSLGEEINMISVIRKIEELIPRHLFDFVSSEIEGIYVGQFEELISREVKAVYKDNKIFMTNEQASEDEMVNDIIHEIAHAIESFAGMEIYSDGYLETEFLRKRKKMIEVLAAEGYRFNVVDFLDSKFSKNLDQFLYKKVGYDKLSLLCIDIFPTPYAMTSLREYFAVGLEEYLYGDKMELKKVSPVLYSKIKSIVEG